MPTIRMAGHECVSATLAIGEIRQLNLVLSEDRIDELHRAINQAINTRPDAPKWLFELTDMMEAARGAVAR